MTHPLSVAIAGLGTVGGGVLKLLRDNADVIAARAGRPIAVTAVSARDRTKDRGVSLSGLRWYEDPVALATDSGVDVVVELIGGAEGCAHHVEMLGALATVAFQTMGPLLARERSDFGGLWHLHVFQRRLET